MKVLSKVLAAFVLVCSIYFVSGGGRVFADIEPILEEGGCSTGTACEKCQCKYNACVGQGYLTCGNHFLYCVNGDYNCTRPGI